MLKKSISLLDDSNYLSINFKAPASEKLTKDRIASLFFAKLIINELTNIVKTPAFFKKNGFFGRDQIQRYLINMPFENLEDEAVRSKLFDAIPNVLGEKYQAEILFLKTEKNHPYTAGNEMANGWHPHEITKYSINVLNYNDQAILKKKEKYYSWDSEVDIQNLNNCLKKLSALLKREISSTDISDSENQIIIVVSEKNKK